MGDVRQQLNHQLFVGFGEAGIASQTQGKDTRSATSEGGGPTDKLSEKLVLSVRVSEESKKGKEKDKDKDKDDDGAKRGKSSRKFRFICITVKKNMKIRIHKVKQSKGGSFTVSKTWGLDDIKSIESIEDTQVLINLGKPYQWRLDDMEKKIEFLFTLAKLCRKYLKKQPKFINVEEDSLRQQMHSDTSFLSATEKEFTNTMAAISKRGKDDVVAEEDEADDILAEDPVLPLMELDGPNIDLGEVLNDFDWEASGDAAALETRLVTELQALEAANVHAIIGSEEQANLVVDQLDHAILQLDQIDEWISHYTQLLDSMGQDVHQIEIRHKGMQIAAANQKALLKEVESILESLRLPAYILDILRNEPLTDVDGISQSEDAVKKLKEVTQRKIDSDVSSLQAIKERLAFLNFHATSFAVRLHDYLNGYFGTLTDAYLHDKARTSKKGDLRLHNHDTLEEKLYRFCFLLRWLKTVDTRKHYNLQMSYVQEIARVYNKEVHDFVEQLRTHHIHRRTESEEQDYVFSLPLVSVSSAATNAIKSAIPFSKASHGTLPTDKPARSGRIKGAPWKSRHRDGDPDTPENDGDDVASLRRRGSTATRSSVAGNSVLSLDIGGDERMPPDEALRHTLSVLLPVMVREQNFITDLFSLHKDGEDLADPQAPTADQPIERIHDWQDSLGQPRPQNNDLKLNKRIHELQQGIFNDVRAEVLGTLDFALKGDQTYAIGMMVAVEDFVDDYKETCHSYLMEVLDDINKKVGGVFEKFLEEQIKAIDESKTTLKKRNGILSFVRTFPKFVQRVENILNGSTGNAQRTINQAYARIIKMIFETLDTMAQQVTVDVKAAPDDKESLNIHILHVENMHHFYSFIRERKVPSLDVYVKQAKSIYDVHLDAYCKVVIRKPLGRLWDFFEGIEGLLKTNTPEEINYHMQYNKGALKEVVRKYPGKEIKKGLESLYKKVEKHFTDEEGLLQVVWRGIQEETAKRYKRYGELIELCYPETVTKLEFTMDELLGYFSELARAH
ncbi:exocyst complex component Sec3-domain-containing protein [Fimicolochytrium jonesii]|uniref:exocyst complex component Sec3-domain-containing protein n=1 Tax=Fimicolochytrium jonesii TaxID=1396493 RepID=UPI0022FE03E3|nr:exocyst complex component Sec3-domain-containing protein [Fimicolochytrium jonesii]KAI8826808.1 exocyst complex component Sec3-domain-containing protein [Fimicolochytrium jonesii]